MNTSQLLLLSGTRHNLIAYPEAFNSWQKSGTTVTDNAAIAPNGAETADKLIATAVFGQHRVDYTPVSDAGSQTFSCHLKAAEYEYGLMRLGVIGGAFILSLVDGVITGEFAGVTATSKPAGNGWFRFSLTTTAAANDVCRIHCLETNAFANFTGDGTSGIYIWGAKLEQAPTMSRYRG